VKDKCQKDIKNILKNLFIKSKKKLVNSMQINQKDNSIEANLLQLNQKMHSINVN
jgi:hypothetical protein